MRAFRLLIILLLLLCLVPPLSLLVAGLAARWASCQLDPNTPVPCAILGSDFGGVLFAIADFGYYAVETIPAFVAILAGWLIVEGMRRIGRPRNPARPPLPRGQRPQPQAPVASRKRVRGS